MSTVIPDSVRGVLRCGECNGLLSCGPVLLIHETSAVICGRCSPLYQQQDQEQIKKEEEASTSLKSTRNLQYEALARLHAFPCKFAERGCQVIMDFSPEKPNTHEGNCPFRPLFCPIVGSESCDWIGSCENLQEHVIDQHADHFYNNPCSLPRPDITKSYLKNFLVTAFNFLFLIQLKVCVTSGKIFHCVRMLEDSKFLEKFTFELKISGNDLNVSKKGSVLRAGLLALQEPTAICTKINSLLDFLGGNYDQTEFHMIIKTSLNFCLNCFKDISHDLKICSECQKNLVKCVFSTNGCLFMDVNAEKCAKHVDMFCKYQSKCFICDVNFVGGSFIEHLNSPTFCQNLIKSKLNTVFRATKTFPENNYVLFTINNCENILLQYYLDNSSLNIWIYSSMLLYELKNLKCSLKITDPQTKHTEIKTPQVNVNDSFDWDIIVNLDNFPSWENVGLDIEMNIE